MAGKNILTVKNYGCLFIRLLNLKENYPAKFPTTYLKFYSNESKLKIEKKIFFMRNIGTILCNSNFGSFYVIERPSEVIKSCHVPDYIIKPSYAKSGLPSPSPLSPEIKTEKQIIGMREACKIACSIMNEISDHVKIGITTEEIDILVRKKAFDLRSYPSPLNYQGFPKSCCTSVNNVACHGIPDTRELKNGDIISIDITVFYKGFHGDCCETFLVGTVDEKGRHLVDASRECRDKAIEICGPDVPFAHIGLQVEDIAREKSISVVPAFTGHGIGDYFHGPPDIYHCFNNYPGVMRPGMTFTVEPILAQGSKEAIILEDGWTVIMLDNGRAAQFEHTILILDNGHEILTNYL